MADNTTPSRAADMERAEGDRSTAYRDVNRDGAGGITNRPFDEEKENQDALPERGRSRSDERSRAEDEWPADRSER